MRVLAAGAGLEGHLREGELIRGGRLGEDVGFASRKGSLVALSLRRCGLTSLPESLAELQGLRQLDLEGNRFSELPGSVRALLDLQCLYLDQNRLRSVPGFIGPRLTTSRATLRSWRGTRPGRLRERPGAPS